MGSGTSGLVALEILTVPDIHSLPQLFHNPHSPKRRAQSAFPPTQLSVNIFRISGIPYIAATVIHSR